MVAVSNLALISTTTALHNRGRGEQSMWTTQQSDPGGQHHTGLPITYVHTPRSRPVISTMTPVRAGQWHNAELIEEIRRERYLKRLVAHFL
jgi:hypothetical protein